MFDGKLIVSFSPVALLIAFGTEPVWRTVHAEHVPVLQVAAGQRIAGVDHGLMCLDVHGHDAKFGRRPWPGCA